MTTALFREERRLAFPAEKRQTGVWLHQKNLYEVETSNILLCSMYFSLANEEEENFHLYHSRRKSQRDEEKEKNDFL